jgi:hypothetical protein
VKGWLKGLTFAETPLSAISRFNWSPESPEARPLLKAAREDGSSFRADLEQSTPNERRFMKSVSRTKSMAVPHQILGASTNEKRELLMCGHSLIARLTIAVFVFQMLDVTSVVHAERPDSTAGTSSAGTRKLFIDPSSASVALAKASLFVSPLTHRDGNYVGDYQLKVRPYFFKSEKGSLLLAASDDAVRKLQAGTAINFTGQAVTHKDGRTHIVLGRATPSSRDRGSVTFSIVTDDARIVFNTSYYFPAPRP